MGQLQLRADDKADDKAFSREPKTLARDILANSELTEHYGEFNCVC